MEKFSDKVRRHLNEFRAEAGPNEWIVYYHDKKVKSGDLPPQQKKIFDQVVSKLKKDKLFKKVSSKKDTRNADMALKGDAAEIYDENGKVLKRYKI